jgi:hypothetical protein
MAAVELAGVQGSLLPGYIYDWWLIVRATFAGLVFHKGSLAHPVASVGMQ